MKSFFATLGRGILYFLTPFAWIIGIAVGGVVALLVFIGYSFYCVFLFFTGRNLFKDLPEDEKAKEILKAQAEAATQPALQAVPQAQTQVFMQSPQVNLYPNAGYPCGPQPQQPYSQQQWQQPAPVQEAYPQVEQEAPAQIQEKVNVEAEPIKEEANKPFIEEPLDPEEESYFEQPEFQVDEISTSDEEEIEEYIPSGGDVYEKDIKGENDD